MNVKNKHVLVVGMARSGIAAAKLLANQGAVVTINDMKAEDAFDGQLDELRALGCAFALGCAPQTCYAGQDMMIISPGIAWAKPFVQEALAAGIEVIGELELGARLTRGAMVAITGTNGKTTTTTLVGEFFRAGGKTTHVVGNIGYPITATAGISEDDDVSVAEVSSYQCESISLFCVGSAPFISTSPPQQATAHATVDAKILSEIILYSTFFNFSTPKI